MGVISDYRVTNYSEYLYDRGKKTRLNEDYQLEFTLNKLTESEVEEIIKYIENKTK